MSEPQLTSEAVFTRRQCDSFLRAYYQSCDQTGGRPNWSDPGMSAARKFLASKFPTYEDACRIGHEAGFKPGTIPIGKGYSYTHRATRNIKLSPHMLWTKMIDEAAKQGKIDDLAQALIRESVPYHPKDTADEIGHALGRYGINASVNYNDSTEKIDVSLSKIDAEEFKRFLRNRVR